MSPGRRDAALLLGAAGIVLHDAVTHLATLGAEAWGTDGLGARVWVVAGLVAGVAAVAGAARARRTRGAPGVGAWLGALVAAGVATGALIALPAEVVHLPWYALVAAVIGGGGARAGARAALLAASVGLVDEGWQAWELYPSRGLDRRDVGLNAVGAALGGLWVGLGPTPPAPAAPAPDRPAAAP